jgi:hypothetical protein
VLLIVPAARAAVTSQTITGNASPTAQRQTVPGAASLNVTFDIGYDSMFTPNLNEAILHFDNDFSFDPSGFSECNLATIQTVPEATARANCPNSVVGTGDLVVKSGDGSSTLTGTIAAFNGQPSGGHPAVYLHTDVFSNGSYAFSTALPGSLVPSSRSGDYGTALDFSIPATGTSVTHFNLTFLNQAPGGHPYVSARCADPDHIWNFAADLNFSDASTASASASQPCQVLPDPPAASTAPTGQRDAALKKCKKKYKKNHNKKKFKKCKKKAKKLPI